MFIIYLSIIGISLFFIVYNYFNTVILHEEKQIEILRAVVTSLAHNIDGDEHEQLTTKYKWRGEINKLGQDSIYDKIHKNIQIAQVKNNFKTPIYTLIYDEDEKIFYYVVVSDTSFAYRYGYEFFPDDLVTKMKTGGAINKYKNENGTWLSAFEPILNSKGEVVALIEADVNFEVFQNEVFYQYLQEALIALIVIVLLALFLIPYIIRILREDENLKLELIEQKNIIDAKNKDLTDSVNYASKIQEAMLPDTSRIEELFPNSFVFYKPRDVVSGDFYWFREKHNEMLIAAADCTGHGIPGALMSMIGHSSLNGINNTTKEKSTATILSELDKSVTTSLVNKEYNSESKDGMDIGICKINLTTRTVEFSGAFQNLLLIRAGEIIEYKGNRFPIGGGANYNKSDFIIHTIETQKGDQFFLYSDGFPDQFGGDKEKKYLDKNFKNFLKTLQGKTSLEKKNSLNEELIQWRGSIEQIDDILVIGISF